MSKIGIKKKISIPFPIFLVSKKNPARGYFFVVDTLLKITNEVSIFLRTLRLTILTAGLPRFHSGQVAQGAQNLAFTSFSRF